LAADISGKRLQLVRELVPSVTSVAVLFNPETPFSALALRELTAASSSAKIQIQPLEAKSAQELPVRFAAAAASGAAALIVLDDPLITSLRAELTRLAAAHRLPAIYGDRLFVEAGGLAAYGPDRRVNFRHAAEYVDKILKGAKAGDLPVEQSAKFDLVLNTGTAKTLALEITPALLARADEVIE
jgi:putative ABC transport system substrate-binding protein